MNSPKIKHTLLAQSLIATMIEDYLDNPNTFCAEFHQYVAESAQNESVAYDDLVQAMEFIAYSLQIKQVG